MLTPTEQVKKALQEHETETYTPETEAFLDRISASDGFWYNITEGRFEVSDLVEEVEEVEAALALIEELAELYCSVAWEY